MHVARLIATVLTLTQAAVAQAWWNSDWTFRKAITLDTTQAGAATTTQLLDVPVLVRLHSGNFGYFLDVDASGKDLRFMSTDDKTPVKYHVEKFDPVNEIALVWFKHTQLALNLATDTVWMYYGNALAPNGADPAGTYDVGQALVYHFSDNPADTRDATAYANQPAAISVKPAPAALIGAGAKFEGAESISLPDSPSLRMVAANGWTFSTWMRVAAPQAEPAFLYDRHEGDAALQIIVDGNAVYARYTDATGAVFETDRAAAQLTLNEWAHVALVVANGQMTIYIDGTARSAVDAAVVDMAAVARVGAGVDETGFLIAELDELQIASVARSADWLKLATLNQGVAAKLPAYGADENQETAGQSDGGHGGPFVIILQNVFGKKEAIVEQLVIGFCGLMAIVAFLVMFFKALFLYRVRTSSNHFLHAYDELGDAGGRGKALDALYESRTFRDSPLFRVYQQGLEEVKRRLGPSVGAATTGLDEKALSSIRATLDATMVRENQRLNSQMVLLTIAISGGPFIGLLGTVVGVMVTFAAIAATGDVNITAIAPGMAAALLATVAGLGVAIPSLFGYNYLGSRIKEVAADMRVFADEFIARINETYGV
jgi:biopolymer transport protein ExbB